MSTENQKDRVLDALVANTEAMTHLTGTVNSLKNDYNEGRKSARQHANTQSAKVDNLDRSIAELRLAQEKSESARSSELKRIYDLLGEERKDRRDAVSEGRDGERDARQNEREMLRELIREEIGDRREQRDTNKNLMVAASKAIWDKGGQWVVAAVALLVISAVMKLTGLSLADVLGLAGK